MSGRSRSRTIKACRVGKSVIVTQRLANDKLREPLVELQQVNLASRPTGVQSHDERREPARSLRGSVCQDHPVDRVKPRQCSDAGAVADEKKRMCPVIEYAPRGQTLQASWCLKTRTSAIVRQRRADSGIESGLAEHSFLRSRPLRENPSSAAAHDLRAPPACRTPCPEADRSPEGLRDLGQARPDYEEPPGLRRPKVTGARIDASREPGA
jgi:hypothetical protein